MDYYLYTHNNIAIRTVEQFVDGANLTSIVRGWNVRELLKYSENGETNLDKIYQNYDYNLQGEELDALYEADKNNLNNPNWSFKIIRLFKGTLLYLPKSVWNSEILISEGKNEITADLPVFIANKLKELHEDAKYYPVNKINLDGFKGITKDMFPSFTVWIWCRALSKIPNDSSEAEQDLEGSILNITPFISKLNTNVIETGGTFSFELAPIEAIWDNSLGWQLTTPTAEFLVGKLDQYNFEADIHKHTKNNELKRNSFFFNNVLKENDLVYIRFETLANEAPSRLKQAKQFEISPSQLPGNTYDMIGLLDAVPITTNFNGINMSIGVTGRDLTKVLIEDGCYFYPQQFISGGIFANETNSQYLTRFEGQLLGLSQSAQKSIDFCIKFIFNALSNIEIVPNSLFSGYSNSGINGSDERSTKFKINEQYLNQLSEIYSEDTIKNFIKESREFNKLSLDETIINQIFNELYNLIETAGREGVLTSTGWKSFTYKGENLVVEKGIDQVIPASINMLLGNKDTVDIAAQNAINSILQRYILLKDKDREKYEEQPVNGIFQIIKFLVDDKIRKKELVDNSIGNEMGSLFNYTQKVAQRPWVEFFGDTYKDQYIFQARKPPFDKESILEFSKFAIDLEEIDVLDENLQFTTGQAVSWYKIEPNGPLQAQANDIAFYFLKAVHFAEYAKIWGEKPLVCVSPYIPSFYSMGKMENNQIGSIVEQIIQDLRYLIETTAYLPFTRQGIITIAGGDRRYKRGTWMRYKGTGELFYIDGVENNSEKRDIEIRTTTLTVSRGMVEKFIGGIKTDNSNNMVNYFNIIDTSFKLEYKNIPKQEIVKGQIKNPTKKFKNISEDKNIIRRASSTQLIRTKKAEGFSQTAYKDGSKGKKSIGHGHQIQPSEKLLYHDKYIMTRSEAGILFSKDIYKYEIAVRNSFQNITQNQFDALFDFAYNAGQNIFIQSYMKSFMILIQNYLKNKTFENKTLLYNKWCQSVITSDGKILAVLKNRRKEEANLFFQDDTLSIDSNEEKAEIEYEEKIISTNQRVLDQQKTMSKFKVNKDVFNFFLRGEQLKY